MNKSQEETPQTQESICRFLRAKNGYGTLEGGELPFVTSDTVTTVYRCLCTGEPFGPDDELAHIELCKMTRACFAAGAIS